MKAPRVLRGLTLALLAVFGMTVGACDQSRAQDGPTDRFIVEPAGAVADALDADFAASSEILRKRLEAFGLQVYNIAPTQGGRLAIEVSGDRPQEALAAAIGIKGDLSLRVVDSMASYADLSVGIAPPGSDILQMPEGEGPIAVKRLGGISGDRLVMARADVDGRTGEPVVWITFDTQGAAKFARVTTENVGQQFAIVLDGEVLSAPIIHEPIVGGGAQISGSFTEESASQLAAALSSGALPTTFVLVDHRRIDADE